MRLLVYGRTGQVATELARLVPEATFLGRDAADLADPEAAAAALAGAAVDAVVNAAAWTAVDAAETQRDAAFAVNAAAPAAIARACAARGLPLVHISTDYVFDGNGDAAVAAGRPPCPARRLRRLEARGRGGRARGRRSARDPAHLVGVLGARERTS